MNVFYFVLISFIGHLFGFFNLQSADVLQKKTLGHYQVEPSDQTNDLLHIFPIHSSVFLNRTLYDLNHHLIVTWEFMAL